MRERLLRQRAGTMLASLAILEVRRRQDGMSDYDVLLLLVILRDELGDWRQILAVAAEISRQKSKDEGALANEVIQRSLLVGSDTTRAMSGLEEALQSCGWNGSAAVAVLMEAIAPDKRVELWKQIPPLAWRTDREGGGETFVDEELYAQGGLGQVWRVRERATGRLVALKQIRPEVADNGPLVRRFLAEGRVTARLEHPSIVPVYHVTESHGGRPPFYVMRLLNGRTLQEGIDHLYRDTKTPGERREPLRELVRRFVSICEAIAYAHSRGVIHRDLKPANIILGDFGSAVLLDWGLAKVLGSPESADAAVMPEGALDQTQPGGVLGTPLWIAPEQAAGNSHCVTEQTDIYGLGATLFSILTGQAPHAVHGSANTAELIAKILKADTPRAKAARPEASAALDAICAKAMAKEPADRYRSTEEMIGDLERWLAGEPVSVLREPWAKRAARAWMAHPARSTFAASVLLVAVICLSLLSAAIWVNDGQAERITLDVLTERTAATSNLVNDDMAKIEQDALFISRLAGVKRLLRDPLASAGNDGNGETIDVLKGFLGRRNEYPRLALVKDANALAAVVQLFRGGAGGDIVVERNKPIPASPGGNPPGGIPSLTASRSVSLWHVVTEETATTQAVVKTYAAAAVREGDQLLGQVWIEVDLHERLKEALSMHRYSTIALTDDQGNVIFWERSRETAAAGMEQVLQEHPRVQEFLADPNSTSQPFVELSRPIVLFARKLLYTFDGERQSLGIVFCVDTSLIRAGPQMMRSILGTIMVAIIVPVAILGLLARRMLIQVAAAD